MASEPASPGPFGLPRVLVWGGGLLVLFLVGFAIGLMVGAGPVANLTQQVEEAEARAEASEGRMADLEARFNAQRALSLLYRTILDVDARNFGTANERLDRVVEALGRVDRDSFGAGTAELEDLHGELEALDVRVAEDLAQQRGVLVDLAERLRALLEA